MSLYWRVRGLPLDPSTVSNESNSAVSRTNHAAARPLLTPDEVERWPASESFVFVDAMPPILARKIVYFRDGEFRA
jgi:type IV secretory pathway TraG/TraD family ATPase VirD4